MSGWMTAAIATLSLQSAAAQVDPLSPLPPSVQSPPQPRISPAPAPVTAAVPTGFEAYKLTLSQRARREGVREATIATYVPTLSLNSRAIELDRSQPGGPPNSSYIPPFSPYQRKHVTPQLISRGQQRYASLYGQLARIHERYGVDPTVLMAIYGHETSFGRVTGNFDLLDVLASLAYEGRRRELFESEFVAALKLLDLGIPRWRLKGSYAGATGYPQFMPSVVLRLRADGDGDGYANIWGSEADGLASIANYLREAGWKPGTAWGAPVRVPANLNRAAVRGRLNASRCPAVYRRHSRWLTVREWRSLGIQQIGRPLPDQELAFLLEPDGPNATAYLLTQNYRAILDYNCSNFYALSVALLADAIARR